MRYAAQPSRPRAYWDDETPFIPQVSVDEQVAVKTGLVTRAGDPIMRLPNPIGFGRDGEW